MKIAVAFITYNEDSFKYLRYFFPSLKEAIKNSKADCPIFVFDNSDPGFNLNQDFFKGEDLIFIRSKKNLGFSRAYNRLISLAIEQGCSYFFMINPDTLVEPEALKLLIKKIKDQSDVSAVVPKILRWDFSNKNKTKIIDSRGLGLNQELRVFDIDQGKEDRLEKENPKIIGFSGAAVLLNLAALEDVAFKKGEYLDDLIFMYKEDQDLSLRLFLAGYQVLYEAQALIYHDRSVASPGSSLLKTFLNRKNKSRQVKIWSWRAQLIIFNRYLNLNLWRPYKLKTFIYKIKSFIYISLFEPYLWREFWALKKDSRELEYKKSQLKVKISFSELAKKLEK